MTNPVQAGPAAPGASVTDRPIAGRAATPIAYVDDRAVAAGAAQALYVVSDAELASGAFVAAAGPALPVTLVSDRIVSAGPAIPVYVVGGGPDPPDAPPVPGYSLWLDALRAGALWQDTARTALAEAGDPVASWYDPTADLAATQPSAAARPVAASGGVMFDGSNDALVLGSLPVHTWPGLTVIAALVTGASIPSYQMALSIAQGGARWGLGPCGDANYRYGWGGNASVLLNSPAGAYATATGYALAWRKGAAAGWRIRRGATDGSLLADASYPAAAPTIWLGAEAVSGTYWFTGELRALLVYPSELSDADLAAVMAWLADRHGVPL